MRVIFNYFFNGIACLIVFVSVGDFVVCCAGFDLKIIKNAI